VSGRRRHSRFRTLAAWSGKMRVWRDVSIYPTENGNEITVFSDTAGVVEEELTLGLMGPSGQVDLRVRVVESNPEIVDGVVQHRLRLLMLDAVQ